MARKKAASAEGEVEVRMLVDHVDNDGTRHRANTVATFDVDTAAGLKGAGIVDDSADAIAYAKSLESRSGEAQ